MGACSGMLISIVSPGLTFLYREKTGDGDPIKSPLEKTSKYEVVHAQEPIFFRRQILEKVSPGLKLLPSGTLKSAEMPTQLQVSAAFAVSTLLAGINWKRIAMHSIAVIIRERFGSIFSSC